MRLLALTLCFVLFIAASLCAADWTPIIPTFKESIVEIAIGNQGACTGVVIDNNRDFVLTAAHCDVTDTTQTIYADNLRAEVKSKDPKNDLMVLFVKDIDRPALRLAAHDPLVGEEVASFGYGYALERPMFRLTHISAVDIAIERGRYIAVDATFVPGQSGGPVVNTKGEIVMVVQLGSGSVGLGVGAETIKDRVGRFFAQQ